MHLQPFDVALLATWAVELLLHFETRQVFGLMRTCLTREDCVFIAKKLATKTEGYHLNTC